jgi:hypothetical protein
LHSPFDPARVFGEIGGSSGLPQRAAECLYCGRLLSCCGCDELDRELEWGVEVDERDFLRGRDG